MNERCEHLECFGDPAKDIKYYRCGIDRDTLTNDVAESCHAGGCGKVIKVAIDDDLKYKLLLFQAIKYLQVMPDGLQLGKSEDEIDKMVIETIAWGLVNLDFKTIFESYKNGLNQVLLESERVK